MDEKARERHAVFRILDANYNRATEALRVLEEYARFWLESEGFCRRIKDIRHRLRAALQTSPLDSIRLPAYRDPCGDVGREPSAAQSGSRSGAADVLLANAARLKEALRALEEYSRIEAVEAARAIEGLRFEAYDLEKSLLLLLFPKGRLVEARLCVLVSGSRRGLSAEEVCRRVLAGGAGMVQLREKAMPAGKLLSAARAIRDLTLAAGILFLVNDRLDIALLSGADGLHLGGEDIPLRDARRVLGPDKILGATAHTPEEARQAERDGADYLGVGPLFASPTKTALEPAGPSGIARIIEEVSLPSFAIGGITAENLEAAFTAGARGVAVASAIVEAEDIEKETRRIADTIKGIPC
jgi:thiamine-phosphate pyrophosphorylase